MAFVKISEQSSLYNDLEKKSVREILEDINTEDQKVALAVQKPIMRVGGIPKVGGISDASSTPRRPLVPAPM